MAAKRKAKPRRELIETLVPVTVIAGVEGASLYINDYRVAGRKPWGGGEVKYLWQVPLEDIRTAITRRTNETRAQRVERLIRELDGSARRLAERVVDLEIQLGVPE